MDQTLRTRSLPVVGSFRKSQGQHIPSRSGLFVPIVGVGMFVFAITNASIESVNLGTVIVSTAGLSLICYRMWSPSARSRIYWFRLILVFLLIALIMQLAPFFFSTVGIGAWLGDKCVPDVVLDSLSILVVGWFAFGELPGVLRNPTRVRLEGAASQQVRVTVYILGLGMGSIFNPSMLTFPYMAAVCMSLFQFGQGACLDSISVGVPSFPRNLIVYTFCYFALSIALCLPVLKDQVRQAGWLAQALGVPKTDAFTNDYYNYSCILPSGISLFVVFILSAWWVSDINKAKGVLKGVPTSGNDNSDRKKSKIFHFFFANFFFPVALVAAALLLPSTCSIPLLLGGLGLLGYPETVKNKKLRSRIEQFLIFLLLCVFCSSAIVISGLLCGKGSLVFSTLESIGFIARSSGATWSIWCQFVLLVSLFSLILVSCVSRRRDFSVPSDNVFELQRRPFVKLQALVVTVLRSPEFLLSIVSSIVIATAAIENQTSAVSVLYFALALPPLADAGGGKISRLCYIGIGIVGTLVTCGIVAHFAWDLAGSIFQDFGFFPKKKKNCFLSALSHVFIILFVTIAHLRLSALPVNLSDSYSLVVGASKVWKYALMAAPMALSLALFVTMPFDYFSALVILCFVIQMSLLQGGRSSSSKGAILRIYFVEVFVLIATVVWVLTSMIPKVNYFVISNLEGGGNAYISASELAVLPNCQYLGKLTLDIALLIIICLLLKQPESLLCFSTGKNFVESMSPILKRTFTIFSSQLTRLLMFTIFLASVFQTNLLNTFSELIICAFLLIGRFWSQVGLVFSTISMLLLFLQYFASFQLVLNLSNFHHLSYLGMTWTQASVARNLAIFVACIVQRNVQNFVRIHFGKSQSVENSYLLFLEKYAYLFTGGILFVGAAGKADFFSFIYLVLGIGFVFVQRRPISIIALRVVAGIVGVCIAVQALTRLWYWGKPRPDLSVFCDTIFQTICLDDWQRFFNLPTSLDGSTALLDSSGLVASIAKSLGFPDAQSFSIPRLPAVNLMYDFTILWVICVLVQNHSIGRSSERIRSRSSDTLVVIARSRRRRFMNRVGIFVCRFWIYLVGIASVLSTFSFRGSVDIFNLVFLTLTVLLLWAHEKPLPVRRRVVLLGIVFSVVYLTAFVVYQIPSFPCKYGDIMADRIPTAFCEGIQQMLEGQENTEAFTWSQIAIQTIGLYKSTSTFSFFGSFPVILLLLLLVQRAMYEVSDTYLRKVDGGYYCSEIWKREMRGRRFVSEFNSKLFLMNRKMNCVLAATHKKLIRVQESADALLRIFYARLAGFAQGEVVRSLTEHLSTEVESLCSRGFSQEEAEIASRLARDSPEGTALLLLEKGQEFGLGVSQESETLCACKNLIEKTLIFSQIKWNEKISTFFASLIDDVCFVTDKEAASPLAVHRNSDGLLQLLMKAIFSNSYSLVVVFCVIAFVNSNSIFDFIRLLLLLFLIPSWPFPSKNLHRFLLWYSFCGIIVKTIYQFPVFCSVGIDGSDSFSAALWRFRNTVSIEPPCPQPTIVGWDVILGMPKMIGSSALNGLKVSGVFLVIWVDLLLLFSLFLHRSRLYKCGVWEHLTVGSLEIDAGAVLVPIKCKTINSNGPPPDLEFDDEDEVLPIESGRWEDGDNEEEDEEEDTSPLGSFVDLNFDPLSFQDLETLSRYSVHRHVSSEDVVVGRFEFDESVFSVERSLMKIFSIYKRLRWEAQFHYGNHQCVRLTVEERSRRNREAKGMIDSLSFFQKMYLKLNPFYAVKVGYDYYTYLFLFAIMMFFHVIVFYPSITGEASSDIFSALKSNQFSAGLALLMAFHFVLIALDRAYYFASFRRSADNEGGPPSKQQVGWYFARFALLVVLTLTLHCLIMENLFSVGSVSPTVSAGNSYMPLRARPALAIYYLEFMAYLVTSFVQLREGFPRVMKESLRPEKSYHAVTDKLQEWRFLVYRAIPFLDELRILIDWTVSKSCLDLFQYFKLEDAHTYMWTTKREIDTRRRMWPAEAIGKVEKSLMGCGFIILLMIVIVGPVLLFSSLVSSGIVAPITKASLSTVVTLSSYDSTSLATSELVFFNALASKFENLSASQVRSFFPRARFDIEPSSSVQQVTFGFQSDWLIRNGSERYVAFQAAMNSAVFVSIKTDIAFQRTAPGGYSGPETTLSMPIVACAPGFEYLCPSGSSIPFDSMLSAANALVDIPDTKVVGIPNVIAPVIEIDSSGAARDAQFGNVSLALASDGNQGYAAVFNWTDSNDHPFEASIISNGGVGALKTTGSQPVFSFVMAPVLSSATGTGTGGALMSVGIVTIYITVVYAIGRFLRYVFDKESLRVIYLEIPRTDDFLDLATGASIARHYTDLPMEFKLYNCLIKVMRSPETLIALGGADVTGYGEGRHDDPPYPELLSEHDRERLRRRRKKKSIPS